MPPPEVIVAAGTGCGTAIGANYGHALAPSALLAGYLGTVSITLAGTILLSGSRSDVYVSWDGGQTWHGMVRTSRSMEWAYQGGAVFSGAAFSGVVFSGAMTTDTQGFTIEPGGGSIWFTYDDVHTWHLVTMH